MPFGGLLAAGIIGGATSIIGGIQTSSAAKNAAKAQAEAANRATQMVQGAANSANDNIAAQGANAANWAITNAQNAGADVKGAARQANNLLDPYVQAGQGAVTSLQDMLAPGGQLSKQFTGADMEAYDPGYQFRLEQGQKALERSAAARGGSLGGGSLKALTRYSQGVASDEYNNAFNRFLAGNQQQYNMRSGLAGMGMSASGQSGQNLLNSNIYAGNANIQGGQFGATALMNAASQMGANQIGAAEYGGNAQMGIGNAQAAANMNSAAGWNSALGGVANAATGVALGSMMNPRPNNNFATYVNGGGLSPSYTAPVLEAPPVFAPTGNTASLPSFLQIPGAPPTVSAAATSYDPWAQVWSASHP